ncbi:MAG: asparagine synthase (glutamine-hydrolyzing) [Phycisphaeraceae bacterium]
MASMIAHRGPDGRGCVVDGPVGLAHSRLSVIDLLGGEQPMGFLPPPLGEGWGEGATEHRAPYAVTGMPTSPGSLLPTSPGGGGAGACVIVFNGEIYNHRELRKLLEARGHRFFTDHSDTEAILHGYQEWGEELPKHLHGMFALAVWSPMTRKLFLARDRAGKKPLYIHRSATQLTFGSVIGAVLAGLDQLPGINRHALAAYLTFGYTMEESLLEGVTELPAAHCMTVDGGGQVKVERYWRTPPLSRTSTKLGAEQAVEELLTEAVDKRLEADVPLGFFLSGGIDSSLIAAMAARLRPRKQLLTFNVAMPDHRYDESRYARRVAEHIGSEHRTLGTDADVMEAMERLIAVTGEPMGDSSLLPTYWLSKAAKEHVTVALSGDGGDELFGGYDRYRAMRWLGRCGGWLRWWPATEHPAQLRSTAGRMARLIHAAKFHRQSRQYLDMVRLFSPKMLGWLGPIIDAPWNDLADWREEADPAEAARRWDMTHYLPFDLLRKVDRASMAVALEVRCPMLDTAVYDLAGHLPLSVLSPKGRAKGLLRQVAGKYLPGEIVNRKKMGFAVPVGEWFKGKLELPLRKWLLSGEMSDQLGFRLARLERMIDHHLSGQADHTHRLFALMGLAMWLRWLKDPKPPEEM